MGPFPIYNAGTPLNNINGGLVNTDSSSVGGIPFSSTTIPNGPHTLAPTGSNVQSAAAIYPCAQKGGKINRRKINKISRKYLMMVNLTKILTVAFHSFCIPFKNYSKTRLIFRKI